MDRNNYLVSVAATELLTRLGGRMRITCRVTDAEAILAGDVPTYYLKQTAQEIVRKMVGSRRIHNRIDVKSAQAT